MLIRIREEKGMIPTEYIPYGDPDSEQLMYDIDTYDDSAYEDQLEEEEIEEPDFFLFL